MKKLFVLSVLLAPMAAFALDTSDCETIGYWQSTATTCELYDECVAWHKDLGRTDYETGCADRPHTDEECVAQIAQANADATKKELLIKCPVSDERMAHKNAEKTSGTDGKFVIAADNSEITVDTMIQDNDFVYYTNVKMPIGRQDVWRAIGPRDSKSQNVFLSVVE